LQLSTIGVHLPLMNVSRLRPCERRRLVDPFARVALNVGCGVNASSPPLLIANAKPSFIQLAMGLVRWRHPSLLGMQCPHFNI
jgi:hypothetical protein